jgi:hypothetical protein
MTYKYKTFTQSQLGQIFGVSSHVIGDWLCQIGLRDKESKKPTKKAHYANLCETAPSGSLGYCWVWNAEETVDVLMKAGHLPISFPPRELVEQSTLKGPFNAKPLKDGSIEIANDDGGVCLIANSEATASQIIELLNLANKHGALRKFVNSQAVI